MFFSLFLSNKSEKFNIKRRILNICFIYEKDKETHHEKLTNINY